MHQRQQDEQDEDEVDDRSPALAGAGAARHRQA